MKLHPIANQPEWLNILVYGRIDSGKTTFGISGCDSKEFSKTLVVNIERGLSSVQWTSAIQTPPITSMSMMDEVIMGVKNQSGDFKGVKTLVVDSLTDLLRLSIDEIVRDRVGVGRGTDVAGRPDYGTRSKYIRRTVALLRDLPCHVVITSLPKDHRESDDGPVVAVDVEAGDALRESIKGMFDNVWMVGKVGSVPKTEEAEEKPAYVLMFTRSSGKYYSRTRSTEFMELLPPRITNPTLPMIHEIYIKSLEAGRKKAQQDNAK